MRLRVTAERLTLTQRWETWDRVHAPGPSAVNTQVTVLITLPSGVNKIHMGECLIHSLTQSLTQ